jgi:hypothetical protein
MPPVKTDTEATLMPMEPAEMVPLLEMPPRKLVTEPTAMPVPKKAAGAEIVPVFMILSANVEIVDRLMPGSPAEEIVPALDMLPVKVEPLIAMAVAVAAILLALSREMPPTIVPVSLIAPVIVLLLNVIPKGLIVPSFVIEPVKLVLVTQKPATVVPIGLSVPVLIWTQAAHADGMPTLNNSVTRALDPSKLRLQ